MQFHKAVTGFANECHHLLAAAIGPMHVHTTVDPPGVGMLQEVAPFARVVNELGSVMVKRQRYSLLVQLGAQLVNKLASAITPSRLSSRANSTDSLTDFSAAAASCRVVPA